jgi:hypothetical protein
MYEFAYCFAINDEVKLSTETASSLIRLIQNRDEIKQVQQFIESSCLGDFLKLDSGVVIFRITPAANKPRTLMEVLDEAGLLDD